MLAWRSEGVSIHSRTWWLGPLGLLTSAIQELQHKSLSEKMLHERYYNFLPVYLASSQ